MIDKSESNVFLDEDVYMKVPKEAQISWSSLLMIFIGMWTALVAVGGGITLGTQITPWIGALGLFLGYMICLGYGYFVGLIGLRERKNTYVILERPFSKIGVLFPAFFVFLIAGTFIGVQVDAITRVLLGVLNIDEVAVLGIITNRGILSIFLCMVMMYTAYRGIKYIKLISWVSMPFYMATILIATFWAIRHFDGELGDILVIQQHDSTFALALFMGVSLYAGFTGMLPDITRFVKSKGDLQKVLVIGYVVASLVPICGVIMGAVYQVEDYALVFAMTGLGFGIFASISLFLAQWTTNDNNAFASGLALSTCFRSANSLNKNIPQLPRSKATLVPIIMGVILAGLGAGATAPLLGAVGALGSWLPSMSGVILAHYYFIERDGKAVYAKGFAAVLTWVLVSTLVHSGILPWGALTGVIGGFVLYIVFFNLIDRPLMRKTESQKADTIA